MSTQVKNIPAMLAACVAECNNCFKSCLQEPEIADLSHCILLDRECAEICTLAISWITLEPETGNEILKLCTKACEACAAECEKHSGMDHCRNCAEACRRCADICRQA